MNRNSFFRTMVKIELPKKEWYICTACSGMGYYEEPRDLHKSGGIVRCSFCVPHKGSRYITYKWVYEDELPKKKKKNIPYVVFASDFYHVFNEWYEKYKPDIRWDVAAMLRNILKIVKFQDKTEYYSWQELNQIIDSSIGVKLVKSYSLGIEELKKRVKEKRRLL